MYQEALTVMKDVVKLYKSAYEWNKVLLPKWEEKANAANASNKIKQIYSRMKNFVRSYEKLQNEIQSFIDELIKVYGNVIKLNDQKARKMYENDWSTNILTGENKKVTLEEVIDYLKSEKK